jgi:hypothetical protein
MTSDEFICLPVKMEFIDPKGNPLEDQTFMDCFGLLLVSRSGMPLLPVTGSSMASLVEKIEELAVHGADLVEKDENVPREDLLFPDDLDFMDKCAQAGVYALEARMFEAEKEVMDELVSGVETEAEALEEDPSEKN